MFEANNRYITCGIDEHLSKELQNYIWMSIDVQISLYSGKIDYLQVFTFRKLGSDVLAITQSQENPNRTTTHYVGYKEEYEKILNEKVFVIDDGAHSTMLFSHEY